jgi:hypothetical protein
MLRDRFGAKDPKTRNANTRYLVFDVERTQNILQGYNDLSKMKINCRVEPTDASDSNDNILEDPFAGFFHTALTKIENNCKYSYDVVRDQNKAGENTYNEKINNSLNKSALKEITEFINNSGDPSAGALFDKFTQELNQPEPKKSTLQNIWSGIEKVLPSGQSISSNATKIISLFS